MRKEVHLGDQLERHLAEIQDTMLEDLMEQ